METRCPRKCERLRYVVARRVDDHTPPPTVRGDDAVLSGPTPSAARPPLTFSLRSPHSPPSPRSPQPRPPTRRRSHLAGFGSSSLSTLAACNKTPYTDRLQAPLFCAGAAAVGRRWRCRRSRRDIAFVEGESLGRC